MARNPKTVKYKVQNCDRIEVEENQEQDKAEEVPEISTLLRTISVSEELQHLHQKDNMEKQRINYLKVGEFTLAEDIAGYIDENDVCDSSTMEEIDSKISRVEQPETSYRRLYNELKITLQDRYAEEYKHGYEKGCKQSRTTLRMYIL